MTAGSQRVLVTGAQGFVGRYLVARLLRDSSLEVVGTGRSPESVAEFTHGVSCGEATVPGPLPAALRGSLVSAREDGRYRYCSADLSDPAAVTRLVDSARPDVVIHAAAALRNAEPNAMQATNRGGTEKLVRALLDGGSTVRRFVFVSSGGVYGAVERLPISEMDPTDPNDPYSESKLAGEVVARALAEATGLSLCIARVFNVVGPGQEEQHICGAVAAQLAGGDSGPRRIRVGALEPTRDFIDVRDVGEALARLAFAENAPNCVNVASGCETAMGWIVRTLLELHGDSNVTLANLPPRPAGVPRHFADVRRLAGCGFRRAFTLRESLASVLAYYRRTVRDRD